MNRRRLIGRKPEYLASARRCAIIFLIVAYTWIGLSHLHSPLEIETVVQTVLVALDSGVPDMGDQTQSPTSAHDHCHSCFPAIDAPRPDLTPLLVTYCYLFFPSTSRFVAHFPRLETPPPKQLAYS